MLEVKRDQAIRDRPKGTGQKGPAKRDQDPKGTKPKRDHGQKGPRPKRDQLKNPEKWGKIEKYSDK